MQKVNILTSPFLDLRLQFCWSLKNNPIFMKLFRGIYAYLYPAKLCLKLVGLGKRPWLIDKWEFEKQELVRISWRSKKKKESFIFKWKEENKNWISLTSTTDCDSSSAKRIKAVAHLEIKGFFLINY